MCFKVNVKVISAFGRVYENVNMESDSLELKQVMMRLYDSPLVAHMSLERLREGYSVHHVTRCNISGALLKYEMVRINED